MCAFFRFLISSLCFYEHMTDAQHKAFKSFFFSHSAASNNTMDSSF